MEDRMKFFFILEIGIYELTEKCAIQYLKGELIRDQILREVREYRLI